MGRTIFCVVVMNPIPRLGVFGSYARGEATENSDIDVAVELNGPMGLNFVAMADEIEGLFGITCYCFRRYFKMYRSYCWLPTDSLVTYKRNAK